MHYSQRKSVEIANQDISHFKPGHFGLRMLLQWKSLIIHIYSASILLRGNNNFNFSVIEMIQLNCYHFIHSERLELPCLPHSQ